MIDVNELKIQPYILISNINIEKDRKKKREKSAYIYIYLSPKQNDKQSIKLFKIINAKENLVYALIQILKLKVLLFFVI